MLLCVASFWLSGCGKGASKELVSLSPNGNFEVKVSGKQEVVLEPYTTSIIINGNEMSDTLLAQIYAKGSLDENSVAFSWKDPEHCLITFQETDGERSLLVSFANQHNTVEELKK